MKLAKTPATTSTASSRVGRWLSVLALLCVLALLWLWLAPGQNAAWSIPAPQVQDLHALRPQMPSLQADAVQQRALQQRLNARPLFVMGRRPPPVPVADAAPPPEPVQDMWAQAQVLGTYASGQQSGVFLLIDGQPQRLLMGEALAGWTLQAVSPDGITLQKGRQQRELEVQKKDLTQGGGVATKQGVARNGTAQQRSPFSVGAPAAASPVEAIADQPRQRRGRPAARAVFGGTASSAESNKSADTDDEAGEASDD